MDVKAISQDVAATLRDMGPDYDPDRLARALKGHEYQLTSRAAQVTLALGGFAARVAKVGAVALSAMAEKPSPS